MGRMDLSSSFFRILANIFLVLPRCVSRGTITSPFRSPSPWPTYSEPGTFRVESGTNYRWAESAEVRGGANVIELSLLTYHKTSGFGRHPLDNMS